jgi:hypothetical protein
MSAGRRWTRSRLERNFAAALGHPGDAVKFLLTDPSGRRIIAAKYVRVEELGSLAAPCAVLSGTDENIVRGYLQEAVSSRIWGDIMKAINGRALGQIKDPEVLYALCRILKPERVVETGVASGISSAFILEALRRNGKGNLFSIDLPNYENVLAQRHAAFYRPGSPGTLPPGLATGWIVPPNLHSLWIIEMGLTSEVLPRLLEQLGSIDLFLHDSEHTYDNMMSEFSTVWSYLRSGGYLLSHDVAWNAAFSDFAENVVREQILLGEIGALRK